MSEITTDELKSAYCFSRLKQLGIGYTQAIESPILLPALRCIARARKKKKSRNHQPVDAVMVDGQIIPDRRKRVNIITANNHSEECTLLIYAAGKCTCHQIDEESGIRNNYP